MSLTTSDRQRRLAAKRMNERLKLAAGFLNAIGIGVVGAAFIIPGVSDFAAVRWSWAVPVVAVSIGVVVYGIAWYSSYRFDRKYGRSE